MAAGNSSKGFMKLKIIAQHSTGREREYEE
jgi:hypothetical protein